MHCLRPVVGHVVAGRSKLVIANVHAAVHTPVFLLSWCMSCSHGVENQQQSKPRRKRCKQNPDILLITNCNKTGSRNCTLPSLLAYTSGACIAQAPVPDVGTLRHTSENHSAAQDTPASGACGEALLKSRLT